MAPDEPDARGRSRERLATRILARAAGQAGALGVVDLQLLLRESSSLESEGRHEQAFALLRAALDHARAQGDRWVAIFLALTAARDRIAALDEESAGAWLDEALGADVAQKPYAAIAHAEQLVVPAVSLRDLSSLRAMALYSVARHLALIGRLGPAAAALSAALRQLGDENDPHLSAPELRLFLAEMLIDQGDLAGFTDLAENRTGGGDRDADVRWELLQASADHLQGRLSQAEGRLRSVVVRADELGRPDVSTAARQQLAMALGALNRLGEAMGVLAELPADSIETTQIANLLRARTAIEDLAAPEPRVMSTEPMRPDVAFADGLASVPDSPRTFERHRQECSFRAQHIRLALHHGDVERAVGLLAWLLLWARGCDSRLLQAEIALVRAHVTVEAGEPHAAAVHAASARAAFVSLGLPVHEREACLVQARCAPQTERAAYNARAAALLETITSGLAGSDGKLYVLNKWAPVDEEILSWLRELDAEVAHRPTRQHHGRVYRTLCRIAGRRGWDSLAADSGRSPVNTSEGDLAERVARRAAALETGLPLDALASRALAKDTALVYYVLLPDRLAVFVVTRNGCRRFWRPTSRAGLWERTARFVAVLQAADPDPKQPYGMNEWLEADRALGDALGLSEIIAGLPAAIRHLRIVPDDVLVHVPFAALSHAGEPLCAHFTVAFVPYPRWVASPPGGLVGISSALGIAVRDTDLDGWPSLPGAPDEVRALTTLPRVNTSILDDAQSTTLERVRAALPLTDLAHFACHGEYFPDKPDSSGLLLRDGWFTVQGIESLRLDGLRMAVLGSCWGANTRVLPGREMVGIAASFLRRGCRTLVTALWELDDAVAPEFATELYRDLSPRDLASAVSAIQARWSGRARPGDHDHAPSSGELRPPCDWAPYVVYERGIVPGPLGRITVWLRLAFRRCVRAVLQRGVNLARS